MLNQFKGIYDMTMLLKGNILGVGVFHQSESSPELIIPLAQYNYPAQANDTPHSTDQGAGTDP